METGPPILRGHPSHAKVSPLAVRAKEVPSFLSHFKTLSNGPARESNPRPPALQSNALPTELILLIIGKTVPLFRRPETEGTLCGRGSTLREVKLIVLSSVIRVSFRAFYKLST